VVTETSVLYTSADLAKDAPPSASEAVETREEKTKLASISETPSARTPTPRFEDSVVTLERDSRAMSAPWVPFSPSGSVCFEVALDARDGWASFGLDFEPGPDGRPRVAAVAETGAAFGEVKVGDVVLETCEVIMVETRDERTAKKRFSSRRGAGATRKTAASRSVLIRCAPSSPSEERVCPTKNAGETKNGAETSLGSEPSPSCALSMRLCRDYVGANAIPMRGEADVEADVRWVDHDGSMEWNEEAIVSGKEWAARHAAGGF
jgi:hypothetical protein